MKTLNIAISDVEYSKFGITSNFLSFSDFIDMVSRELMRGNLETAVKTAEANGLSSMTMNHITAEVKAIRQSAKNYS
ncbi:MAG: hypothetical protein FWG99_06100 [Treponema sp.]|nr:hypothetical protein [Treponema sp.]